MRKSIFSRQIITMDISWTVLSVTLLLSNLSMVMVAADAQINLLNSGCSQYNATSLSAFFANLNGTFSDLRTQISNSSNHFATAQRSRSSDPVYGMVQCRNYLSTSDCLSCFDDAVARIRRCSAANGARVIYDGCFLRYESNGFFDQTTLPGNLGICGNKTQPAGATFGSAANGLLTDIVAVTPRIRGYFAASSREVGSNGIVVYGVAQCANTVSETGCRDCLTVAYNNLQTCPPDSQGRAVDAGCFLRYSDTAFFDANQTTDLSSLLRKGKSNHTGAIIGGVVGGVFILFLLIMVIIWLRFFRKDRKGAHKGDILGATELRGPMNFSYKDLSSATKNFSEENKLGEGGFGDVYKGILKNGKIVAIKKLAIGQSSRAKADFDSEVRLITNVHHRNLIRLLGCCSKNQELLLVYEYMANRSLDNFIFGDRRGNLKWKQRFDIIVGTARGLAYLHDDFHSCIIHRDIKSSNILLDDDFQPKIADFGLARLLPDDQSHLTTRFAGTLGYTAPEYAIHGQLSVKVDTYSYGVVVLEIISGRKCNDLKLEPISQYLLEWAWKLYEDDKLMELVDRSLDPYEYKAADVKKVIEIALLCTQSSVISRPTMSEVVVLLLGKGWMDNKPTRPTFIDATKRVHGDTSTSTASSTSNATVSITEVSSR